jgi:hypothetical protein
MTDLLPGDMLLQVVLATFGLASLFMALDARPTLRRWAPLVGLVGQPAWLLFAWGLDAWGMFAVSVAYTLVYLRGAWVQWGRP